MISAKWWATALVAGTLVASVLGAGSLTPTNAPAPSMRSLDEIYQKVAFLDTNLVTIVVATNVFPSYGNALLKTGQTNSFYAGDDGDLERGSAPPVPRFTDNANGTITDNATGLIWLKDLNAFSITNTWTNALDDCAALSTGEHGLSDGSTNGQWRMPNVRELFSLLDFGRNGPALPAGHPFTNFVSVPFYWSSTTHNTFTDSALCIRLDGFHMESQFKGLSYPVLPVRGGP